MRELCTHLWRNLVRTDIHITVNLTRVGVDHLNGEILTKLERKRSLASCSLSPDGNHTIGMGIEKALHICGNLLNIVVGNLICLHTIVIVKTVIQKRSKHEVLIL